MNKDDKDITHWWEANEKKIIIALVIIIVISGIFSGKFTVDNLNNLISGLFKNIILPGLGLFIICIASGMYKNSIEDVIKNKKDTEYSDCLLTIVIFMFVAAGLLAGI